MLALVGGPDDDEDWATVQLGDKKGLVPRNYVRKI